jgi:hypothetical protein
MQHADRPKRMPVVAAVSGLATACVLGLSGCGHLDPGVPAGSSTWAGKPVATATSASRSQPLPAPASSQVLAAPTFCDDVSVNSSFLGKIPTTPQAAISVQSTWAALAREGPAAIKAQLATISGGVSQVARGQGGSVDTDAFSSALTTVSHWVQSNCTKASTESKSAAAS